MVHQAQVWKPLCGRATCHFLTFLGQSKSRDHFKNKGKNTGPFKVRKLWLCCTSKGKNLKYLVKGVKDKYNEIYVSGPPGNTEQLSWIASQKDARPWEPGLPGWWGLMGHGKIKGVVSSGINIWGSPNITESKLILLAAWQANKLRDKGQRIVTSLGKTAKQEGGELVSQRTISPVLEFRNCFSFFHLFLLVGG